MIKFLQCKRAVFGFLQLFLKKTTWTIVLSACLIVVALGSCTQPYVSSTDNSGEQRVVTFATKAGRALGVVVDKDFIVIDVDPQSAAEAAGIHKGDVLESIENMPFAEGSDSIRYLVGDYTDEDKPLQIKVRRDGQELVMEVKPLPPSINEAADGKPLPTATPVLSPYDYY